MKTNDVMDTLFIYYIKSLPNEKLLFLFSFCSGLLLFQVRGPRWIRTHKTSVQGPPYIVQNLVEGNQYEFRVYARNVMGLSEPSEMSQSVVCHTHDGEFERKKIYSITRISFVYNIVIWL